MRHVISALVQNIPGVLAHVAGMFASRGYNIDSLAVGETEDPQLSRMTFVVVGDDGTLEQVRKQLEKIVTVVRVDDISSQDFVERDLMLLKVNATAGEQRTAIRELTEIFRGRIVDVGQDGLMIEISGKECKIEAFIDRIRPFGITELVRTGRIALVRGGQQHRCEEDVSGNNVGEDAG
jgi:acetolactate synthase-1/3 small subunit